MFGLNYIYYLLSACFIHLCVLYVLFITIRKLTGKKFLALTGLFLFTVNLTYVEPLFWFSANGIVLSVLFLGIGFYYWQKYLDIHNRRDLYFSSISLFLSGMSFGLGLGVGFVFSVITFIHNLSNGYSVNKYRTATIAYSLIGILSVVAGPVFVFWKTGILKPETTNYFFDFFRFIAFVISGVARGVVGRFFLPGFEPRHFQIFLTVISFVPFIIISVILVKMLIWERKKAITKIVMPLVILVFYPYVWSGFLRYQYGLKQALAERYAYPSIYFFVILLMMLVNNYYPKKDVSIKRTIVVAVVLYLFFQSHALFVNINKFGDKAVMTEKYMESIKYLSNNNADVLDLHVPSYINQPFFISDVSVLFDGNNKFIPEKDFICSSSWREILEDDKTYDIYMKMLDDPYLKNDEFRNLMELCKN